MTAMVTYIVARFQITPDKRFQGIINRTAGTCEHLKYLVLLIDPGHGGPFLRQLPH